MLPTNRGTASFWCSGTGWISRQPRSSVLGSDLFSRAPTMDRATIRRHRSTWLKPPAVSSSSRLPTFWVLGQCVPDSWRGWPNNWGEVNIDWCLYRQRSLSITRCLVWHHIDRKGIEIGPELGEVTPLILLRPLQICLMHTRRHASRTK